jgi:uncharacterized protein
MAEKRSISAREALADISVGMPDDQLMAKHSLTEKGLRSLKNKLLAAGLLDQDQLDKSTLVEVPQESDTRVLARKIAEAVRAEWSDEEIAKTFGLLPDKLPNVFPLLIKHGYMSQEDYDRRQSLLDEVVDIKLDFEPALTDIHATAELAQPTATQGGAQIPLRGDSKTMAGRIADAVKAGWSDEEIATTFGLPTERLANVCNALIEYGYLSQEDFERREARREGIIDIEQHAESASASPEAQTDAPVPFARPRGRAIIGSIMLAGLASVIIADIMWKDWGKTQWLPLPTATLMILFDSFLLLLIARMVSRARLDSMILLGTPPPWSRLGRYALFALPLIGCSYASVFLLYFPLSYLTPEFVKWWLLDMDLALVWTSGSGYMLANVLSFWSVVLLGPIVEEFLFRGLLLTRWTVKWGVQSAILWSSLVFGLLHTDIIGAFLFGYVLAVLYIHTKSLFVPISIHVANNCIAWIWAGVEGLVRTSDAQMTLAEWQSFWWIGLLAGLIVIPWVIWFVRRHSPKPDWRVPYVALQEAA